MNATYLLRLIIAQLLQNSSEIKDNWVQFRWKSILATVWATMSEVFRFTLCWFLPNERSVYVFGSGRRHCKGKKEWPRDASSSSYRWRIRIKVNLWIKRVELKRDLPVRRNMGRLFHWNAVISPILKYFV